MLPLALGTLGRCPKEPDHTVRLKVTPYVLKQKSSIESRLKRFFIPTACISVSDERKRNSLK